jgi:hypothetical protein
VESAVEGGDNGVAFSQFGFHAATSLCLGG